MEKEVLLGLYKQTNKESRRAHAILLVKEGHKVSEVAKLVYVEEDTVRNWVKEWEENKQVEDKPRSGRPRKITKDIEKELCKVVDENKPEEHGFHTSSWDCKELSIWLRLKYGVEATIVPQLNN
jgi:transposase